MSGHGRAIRQLDADGRARLKGQDAAPRSRWRHSRTADSGSLALRTVLLRIPAVCSPGRLAKSDSSPWRLKFLTDVVFPRYSI